MEQKISHISCKLWQVINLLQVLNDSLKLSYTDNKKNDYQYSFSEKILEELFCVADELEQLDCELCALQSEKNTRH